MKWRTDKIGAKRTKYRFLFFPINIDDETKWLTMAAWEEMYMEVDYPFGQTAYEWVRTRWLED